MIWDVCPSLSRWAAGFPPWPAPPVAASPGRSSAARRGRRPAVRPRSPHRAGRWSCPSRSPGNASRTRARETERQLGAPLGFVVNIVTAAANEATTGGGQRRRICFRGRFHLSRQRETVARRDKAAFPNDQIDAEILVAEGEAKRRRDVEIALAGRRIDVGRPAAPVLAVDRECRRRSARRGRSSRTPPRVWRRRYRCWRGSGAGRSGSATGRRGQRAGRVTLKRRFAWDFHAEAG
jgi:hypothetical protein